MGFYLSLQLNSDKLLVLNGKRELGSGFAHCGIFTNEGSRFVVQGFVIFLCFCLGFGTFADNDEYILFILRNDGYPLLGIYYH